MPGMVASLDADWIAAMGGQNGLVELGNLCLDPEQHRGQRLERNPSCRGEVWIGLLVEESDQLARVASPLRHHDAQLCEVTAQGIDQGRSLPDQEIAGSVQHEGALLLRALDRDEAHRRPRDGLADRRRVRGIILLSAQIGFDIGGRDQADLMAESHERARPMMSRRAGLQSDQARGKGFEETWNLAAPQRLAQDDLSTPVHAVELEDVLCDIKADRGNLRHDVVPLRFFNMPILARLTLVEGAIHDITLTSHRAH